MKPTPQISSSQDTPPSFPLTDYSFQAIAEAPKSAAATLPATKRLAFYKLSSEFFGQEMHRDYLAEFFCFTLIVGISAWPIMSALVAVTRLVRNY
jgi:hypothetical protein